MKGEKKIFLEKSDGLEAAVGKIIDAPSASVILNVPKNSILGLSQSNFRVLKRESETAGKALMVESIDDHILELAATAKLTAVNPVFKTKERTMSDILPRERASRAPARRKTSDDREVTESQFWAKREDREPRKEPPAKEATYAVRAIEPHIEEPLPKRRSRVRGWRIAFSVCAAVFLFAGFYMYFIAPSAKVTLAFKKTVVPVEVTVKVDRAFNEAGSEGSVIRIPGELLSATSNLTEDFPAAGKETVSTKAEGTLRIFNAFGSNPQSLVATTRFESPEGKIFRIKKAIIVPGSTVEGGKIIPSHIDAAVVADAPGADYNIAPTGRWTIPGFKGTPKFSGFYAEAAGPMTGGFVGERPTASADDLARAEQETERMLREALESKMLLSETAGQFKILDGSTRFSVTRKELPVHSGEEGTFGVFMEGEMKQIVFEEKALTDAIVAFAAKGVKGEKAGTFEISYGAPSFDFANGSASFSASGTVVLVPDIDLSAFRENILGADEAKVREAMWALPGIESASASFWPFWVHTVPQNASKVEVTAE